jgi:hypothetical protein
MSVASALVPGNVASAMTVSAPQARTRTLLSRVATIGIVVLASAAPFEALRPLVQVPGQSLTTVETVLLAVLSAFGACAIGTGAWRSIARDWMVTWSPLVIAALVSACLAPVFRANAVHMAARVATMSAVWAVGGAASTSASSRRVVMTAVVASGTLVGILVIADFMVSAGIGPFLARFKTGVAIVGAQVRASGPFQYPTIASMYMEIAFAIGLGVLVERDRHQIWSTVLLIASMAVVSEAIVLTFTRAGLIAMAASLAAVGWLRWTRQGVGRAHAHLALLVAVIAVQLLSSRSLEMLTLRLTSEGQGRWFSARIEAPPDLRLETRQQLMVPLTLTNVGRATWDSHAQEPIKLSYHWVEADSDDVVAWEGTRTMFEAPVRPGQRVTVHARVGAPHRPGAFRLMWDIEQEHRLWFSTEPDAVPVFTRAVVTGATTAAPAETRHFTIPKVEVRPGRLVLWTAALRMFARHPWFGVGPDNYRLTYGEYARLRTADPRVHSNNMYLEVLAGTGLAGAAATMWLGWRVVAGVRAAMGLGGAAGVVAACLAIALHGLVDSFLSFTGTYMLIAVALGLAAGCEQERHAHRV